MRHFEKDSIEQLIVEALKFFPLDIYNFYGMDPDVNKRKYITEKVIEDHAMRKWDQYALLDGKGIQPLRQWPIL